MLWRLKRSQAIEQKRCVSLLMKLTKCSSTSPPAAALFLLCPRFFRFTSFISSCSHHGWNFTSPVDLTSITDYFFGFGFLFLPSFSSASCNIYISLSFIPPSSPSVLLWLHHLHFTSSSYFMIYSSPFPSTCDTFSFFLVRPWLYLPLLHPVFPSFQPFFSLIHLFFHVNLGQL